MHPILRNILAVLFGLAVGSAVNMGLVMLGHAIFPMEGVDPNDMEALGNFLSDADTGPVHFLAPFFAHALGTLAGALVAGTIAATRKMTFAMVIGVVSLLGGIGASYIIPAPSWFIALDLIVAYIPMAWLGGKLAIRKK